MVSLQTVDMDAFPVVPDYNLKVVKPLLKGCTQFYSHRKLNGIKIWYSRGGINTAISAQKARIGEPKL
jgi:hypothetical protein